MSSERKGVQKRRNGKKEDERGGEEQLEEKYEA